MFVAIESAYVAFTPFNCISIYGLQNQMLYYEHSIICWDSDHQTWTFGLALPLLLIWNFALPIALALKLYFNLDLIHKRDIDFIMKYGSVFESFNESCLYWEFLTYFNKISGVIVVTFFARATEGINGLLMVVMLFFMYSKQKSELPYRRKK